MELSSCGQEAWCQVPKRQASKQTSRRVESGWQPVEETDAADLVAVTPPASGVGVGVGGEDAFFSCLTALVNWPCSGYESRCKSNL